MAFREGLCPAEVEPVSPRRKRSEHDPIPIGYGMLAPPCNTRVKDLHASVGSELKNRRGRAVGRERGRQREILGTEVEERHLAWPREP